jgi:competence protein ComEA
MGPVAKRRGFARSAMNWTRHFLEPGSDRLAAHLGRWQTLAWRHSRADAVLEYLVKNFRLMSSRKSVNKAATIDLESGLSLKRSQAAAIIQYREKNGPFKSIEEVKKVPGIDVEKIEAKKDRLTFER